MWRHHGVWWISRRASSPTCSGAGLALCLAAGRIDEQRRLVLIAGGAAPPGDVPEHVEYLLDGQSGRRRDRFGGDAVVERIHAQVQGAQRNAEEELFLRLRKRVGVGGRRAAADLVG